MDRDLPSQSSRVSPALPGERRLGAARASDSGQRVTHGDDGDLLPARASRRRDHANSLGNHGAAAAHQGAVSSRMTKAIVVVLVLAVVLVYVARRARKSRSGPIGAFKRSRDRNANGDQPDNTEDQ